jgi:hypothetical protein
LQRTVADSESTRYVIINCPFILSLVHDMLGRPTKQKRTDEASEPLLSSSSSREHHESNGEDDEDVLFSVQDDDLDDLDTAPSHRTNTRAVRFEDDVHVIAPSLRSTIQSREARTLDLLSAFASSVS